MYNLLTKIGPRIAKLSRSGYYGCGFHYDMQQSFAKLVHKLALPWKPCANHCEDVNDDRASGVISEVIYRSILIDVECAEASLIVMPKNRDEAEATRVIVEKLVDARLEKESKHIDIPAK